LADYICAVRTNYFSVKDEAKFRELMSCVYANCKEIEIFEQKNTPPEYRKFAFGCLGEISGLRNANDDEDEECEESAYDEFISSLQQCVADDDAIIIYEIGHEKLNYIVGMATIITSTTVKVANMQTVARDIARDALRNENWITTSAY